MKGENERVNMNVKRKIASFEAYNKQISRSSAPSEATMRYHVSHTPSNADCIPDGGGSVVSSTSMASQNRRNRLQESVRPEPPRKRYAERRRLRQQGKGKRSEQPNQAGQASVSSGQHQPSQRSKYLEPVSMSSRRRFVHTVSHESSAEELGGKSSSSGDGADAPELLSPNRRLSPARIAKAYRMQRMRQAAEESSHNGRVPSTPPRADASHQQLQGQPTSPRNTQTYQIYEDDDTQFNSLGNAHTAEDDATLTSVRQIVSGSNKDDTTMPSIGLQRLRNSNQMSNGTGRSYRNMDATHWGAKRDEEHAGVMLRVTSSSDYESDGNNNRDAYDPGRMSSRTNRSDPPYADSAMKAFLSQSRSSRLDDDERTHDYGSLNDDSSHGSFDTARKEAERRAKAESDLKASAGFVANEARSPLINQEDLDYFKKSLDSGVAKAAAGVVAAGAVGGLVLGPVGILLGVAAVGIGVGAMQVPEEQRNNVKDKATNAILQATESISTGCAAACIQSGVIDQMPPEMTKCYSPTDSEDGDSERKADAKNNENASVHPSEANTERSIENQSNANFNTAMRGLIPEGNGRKFQPTRRAACLRDVRINPVSQIHGLSPAMQPRAWLDVMASANTTIDEKNEAMEEIQILAKDKKHTRLFLDEGILDSLMLIINSYFAEVESSTPMPPNEVMSARLAASCCITLGKVHCALAHTGGDLLLMSMYEHGKVPEDRQLAQMLYETPHHVCVVKPGDYSAMIQQGKEVFVLKTLTMPQAQELARSLMILAEGK